MQLYIPSTRASSLFQTSILNYSQTYYTYYQVWCEFVILFHFFSCCHNTNQYIGIKEQYTVYPTLKANRLLGNRRGHAINEIWYRKEKDVLNIKWISVTKLITYSITLQVKTNKNTNHLLSVGDARFYVRCKPIISLF